MCVIIVKKAGALVPTKQMLFDAYKANPHGCGFATAHADGTIYSYKNCSFDKFYKRFKSNVLATDNTIIHFRLATHGSRCTANCHPFANESKTLFFAHNGVLPIESVNNQTDSQILFDSVLSKSADLYGVDSATFKKIVDSVIESSKFAFLDGQNVYMFGRFEYYKGLYFSNLRGIGYSPTIGYGYRNVAFYSSIFAEHNKAYKTNKYSFGGDDYDEEDDDVFVNDEHVVEELPF